MKKDYNEKKKELLEIKQQIDNMIETDGVNSKLINLERKLDLVFNECINSCNEEQDKNYISFNYYPCKALITLSKSLEYKALIECLRGFKFFIDYVKNVSNIEKWLRSFEYYKSRLKIIVDSHLEIFGNIDNQRICEILVHFEEIINLNLPKEIKKKCFEIVLETIKEIILCSSEIYTNEHLNRKQRISNLLDKILPDNDYLIEGKLYQIKFILTKKHLFFLLRRIIRNKVDKGYELDEEIKNLVNELEKIAGKEKNAFNKTGNKFEKFLAQIDVLTVDYYKKLWVDKDLIKAVKTLENVFKEIRRNIQLLIISFSLPSLFDYFINEYLFIINFIKLLLVRKNFEDFASKNDMKWQKQLAQDVKNQLDKAIEYFKFPAITIKSRELLIIQEEITGKFMEFIIFYLLKEIALKILKEDVLKNKVLSQKEEINEILKLIKECSDPDVDIQLNKQQNGTDIDVLIKSKYALFIKTGIISSSDKTKIKNEFEVAINAKYNPYFILDIGKNFSILNFINSLNKDLVKIVDVGEFFEEIYRISQDLKISIGLPRSAIKSFAGFTGG